jgi:hypothetical protein
VDKVLVALGSDSFAAANREQFYVSVSRGREAVRLYTDDKEAMMDAVLGSAARLSATELMHGVNPLPPHEPATTNRFVNTHQVKRTYNRLRERIAGYDLLQAFARRQGEGVGHGKY